MEVNNLKTLILLLIGITLLGAFLRLYGIGDQPFLGDEIESAFSAVHYMEGGQFGPTMWYHPNLRNIVIYLFGESAGYGNYSLRAMSLITGILSIPLMAFLLYVLTRNKAVTLLGAFLLSVEEVHIAFSRQTIQEVWTTFFFLFGVLLSVLYYKKGRPSLLILSGIMFGFGMASKFHAIPPLLACLGWGLYRSWKERSFSRGLFIFSGLVFIPLSVYLLTFVPWFSRGYSFTEWLYMQKILFLKMMIHEGTSMDKVVDTKAWQWFLRPMGYINFVNYGGKKFITVAFSNPFVWLMVLPSTSFLIWGAFKKKYSGDELKGILFILILFVASYLPLAFSSRPIWLLSSLATIPFAFMAVSVAAGRIAETLRWGRSILMVYVIIVFLSSIALYPLSCGKDRFPLYLDGIVKKYLQPFVTK